jgi:serine/threonine protein kinase
MSLEPGASLLHYRIAEKLGEGGMGEVWRAVDTSLDREVAIKVLLSQVASQSDRLARFDREARLLASLNHPNIAAIYGFHEHEGTRFVVMEMVEGEDLSQRIQRGAIPIEEALEIASRITEALAAAHDKGVIHRDLKPANVRVTPDGTVKVLDFGLAKSLDPAADSGDDPSSSPTVTSGGTAFGMIMGTAAYMSPEQARGKPVDRRADLWAFGCVLYEMLTGRRAFGGETVTDTLAEVVGKEPDWSLLPARTSPAVWRLLKRCLNKDAAQRVRDAADARLELFEADEAPASATAARKRSPLALFLAALVGAVAVGAAWMLSSTSPEPRLPDGLPLLRQATFTGDVVEPSAVGGASVNSIVGLDLSTDGRTAVYLTRGRDRAIMIDLDGGGSRNLYSATDGTTLYDAIWSADGDRVYLMTWPYSERVFSVPRLGGEMRPEFDLSGLAGLNGIFLRALPDDRWLLFGNHNTLYVGDDPGLLGINGTQLDGDGVFRIEGLDLLHNAVPSPNGQHIAFHGTGTSGDPRAGVADAAGSSGIVDGWEGLEPVSWSDGGSTLWLWRRTGPAMGDLLRVDVNTGGRPQGDPKLVFPRLTARSVQVGPNGDRVLVRSGDNVANVHELTIDATPDAADNPVRVLTRGTGRWKATDYMADGTLVAALATELRGELFSISPDAVQRSIVHTEVLASFGVAASRDGGRLAIAVDGPGRWSA